MSKNLMIKLSYLIFCEKHTPLKLKRILENKEKKYQDEIIKFTRTIEKYYQTYNSEHKVRAMQIAKSKKLFKKFIQKSRTEQTRDTRNFAFSLKQCFKSEEENNFVIYLNKISDQLDEPLENSADLTKYDIFETNIPKKIITCIRKHDDFWNKFQFKNLEPSRLYKKYYSIIKRYKLPIGLEHEPKRVDTKKEKIIAKDKKKTQPLITPINLEYEEDPNNLYCVCRRPYLEGDKMMGLLFLKKNSQ